MIFCSSLVADRNARSYRSGGNRFTTAFISPQSGMADCG